MKHSQLKYGSTLNPLNLILEFRSVNINISVVILGYSNMHQR